MTPYYVRLKFAGQVTRPKIQNLISYRNETLSIFFDGPQRKRDLVQNILCF